MSYDTAKRERIIQLRSEIRNLQEKEETLLVELQEGCTHESVVECGGSPPLRICAICATEEEGWGSGYKKLTATPIRTVSSKDSRYEYRKLLPLAMVMVPVDSA